MRPGSGIEFFGNSQRSSSVTTPNTSPLNNLKIKAHYQDELFSLPVPLSQLSLKEINVRIAQKMALLGFSEAPNGRWRVKFVDEEGDQVALLTEADLEEAVQVAKSIQVLHIYIYD
jgi:hypothetical protein